MQTVHGIPCSHALKTIARILDPDQAITRVETSKIAVAMVNKRWIDKYFMENYEKDREKVSETIKANIKSL
jgi:hypothetical protein